MLEVKLWCEGIDSTKPDAISVVITTIEKCLPLAD